jgi:hypothetical protein
MVRKGGCWFNSTVINKLAVEGAEEPALISLGFIHQNRPIYEIKSIGYSVLYFLDYEKVLTILKES